MAQIDCTLNSLDIPALSTFTPIFGTKKPSGGLSTSEVNKNVLMPFSKQRPFVVAEDSTTTAIEADCRFVITATGVTLALGDPIFTGCEVIVVNGSSDDAIVSFSGSFITLIPGDKAEFISSAANWIVTQTAVSAPSAGRIAKFDANKRLKSGAAPSASDDVVRKAELDLKASLDVATEDTNGLMSAADKTKLAGLRDGYPPLYFQYVQHASAASNDFNVAFPENRRPENLWPGTKWNKLWESEKVFFRTGGSLSDGSGRTSGKQDAQSQLPSHAHTGPSHRHGFSYTLLSTGTGSVAPGVVAFAGITGSTTKSDNTNYDGTGDTGYAGDSNETRPVNRFMIIWERYE
jgi:hypothetical protein